ncbi:hypothetical protein PTKIN_Ptkin04bG0018900 [Pterospermum kingtungense]
MLSGVNGGVVWMKDKEDEDSSGSWNRTTTTNSNNNNNNQNSVMMENKEEPGCCFSTFKSMLEQDWYVSNNNLDLSFPPNLGDHHLHHQDNLLLHHHHHHHHQVDSSSSCSPSSSVFNNLDPSQVPFFLQPKPTLSSLLNVIPNNPLDHGFDLSEIGFLDNQATNTSILLNRRNTGVLSSFSDVGDGNQIDTANLCHETQFSSSPMVQLLENGGRFTGFQGFDENPGNSLFLNRSKLLRPLESFPSVGAQPTLFQKRAALRKNSADNGGNLGVLGQGKSNASSRIEGEENKERKINNGDDDVGDVSIDGSGLNYDSDEFTETNKVDEGLKNGGSTSNANSTVTRGDQKGKKKGLPAKNLMAERRRRKKLNDRLYMLRSVVPKISKMDRASILGDAIEYLQELLQRINDLQNELDSNPPSSSLTPTTSFHPLTPTPATFPGRIKDELCPSSLPSPNGQPARVEVRLREGKAVNIHMFCGRRPGLLLSTMRALDNLGLDIQQAVISCFNGFAMDIFRAEQCKEGQEIHPEQIKAVLLDSAGFHNMA